MDDILSLENNRQKELYSLNILDTEYEPSFQGQVELAALIADCPFALITLADDNRLWFKARYNIEEVECERENSFCQLTMDNSKDVFEISNLLEDVRFQNVPSVNCSDGLRFYAGKALISSNGFILGTVCILDQNVRKLTDNQKKQLCLISKQIVKLIELKSKFTKESDKVKKELALMATLNHEIRTPINSIVGHLDILKKTKNNSSEKFSKQVSLIHSTASHLVRLVNNSLDYLKLDAGKMKLEIIPNDINLLLKQVKNMVIHLAKENSTKMDFKISEAVPSLVDIDEILFKQIVTNLVSNAIKFSPEGRVHVSVDYNLIAEQLIIDVVDNGMGMDDQDLERIFYPYSQLSSAKKIPQKGTGLGLSISRELAKQFSGKVEVISSAVGEGTHFRTVLQVKASEQNLEILPKRTLKCFDGNKKILVVDDAKENLFLFKHYMNTFPYEIVTVQDNLEALVKYQKESFDYVFLDIDLGNYSGVDLKAKMKKIKPNGSEVFIAFTGRTNQVEEEDFIASGFDHLVSKPFDDQSILKVLN